MEPKELLPYIKEYASYGNPEERLKTLAEFLDAVNLERSNSVYLKSMTSAFGESFIPLDLVYIVLDFIPVYRNSRGLKWELVTCANLDKVELSCIEDSIEEEKKRLEKELAEGMREVCERLKSEKPKEEAAGAEQVPGVEEKDKVERLVQTFENLSSADRADFFRELMKSKKSPKKKANTKKPRTPLSIVKSSVLALIAKIDDINEDSEARVRVKKAGVGDLVRTENAVYLVSQKCGGLKLEKVANNISLGSERDELSFEVVRKIVTAGFDMTYYRALKLKFVIPESDPLHISLTKLMRLKPEEGITFIPKYGSHRMDKDEAKPRFRECSEPEEGEAITSSILLLVWQSKDRNMKSKRDELDDYQEPSIFLETHPIQSIFPPDKRSVTYIGSDREEKDSLRLGLRLVFKEGSLSDSTRSYMAVSYTAASWDPEWDTHSNDMFISEVDSIFSSS